MLGRKVVKFSSKGEAIMFDLDDTLQNFKSSKDHVN